MADETIRVAEEALDVSSRRRVTGKVVVEKKVVEDEVPLDLDFASEEVQVRRVKVELLVDEPVPDRREGDSLVVSVHEEVLVVQRRLKVVEELHITRRRTTRHQRRAERRRREVVQIRRDPA